LRLARVLLFIGMTWKRAQRSMIAAALLGAAAVMPAVVPSLGGSAADAIDASADADTERAVFQALWADLGEDAAQVDVHAQSGVVTLTGVVPSPMSRDRAEKIAYGVAAVEHVENRLRILRAPFNPRAL
jgi:osmotically-inducible protein OsmY